MRKLLILLVLTCGCSLQDAYVNADRLTYQAVAPEYRAYVKADEKLDDEQKARRERTVDAWAVRVTEGSDQ